MRRSTAIIGLTAAALATLVVPAQARQAGHASGHPPKDEKQAVAVGYGGAVSSVDLDASESGIEVLRHGGNAIDAAVATAATLGVTEPFVSAIGGGGYLTYYDARTHKVTTFDGRETGPAKMTKDIFIDPTTGKPKKFAYPPNLIVVDGGAPQVAAASAVLAELGVDDVALVGLAKRLEEVWLPGEAYPAILPRASEGLYLLQRVRDEAHRFAITFHRQKRSKAMTASALDGVAGLGETRRKALLTHFGSLKRLRAASAEQIAEVPGVGPRTAAAIVAALAAGQPADGNPTGGEEDVQNVSAREGE